MNPLRATILIAIAGWRLSLTLSNLCGRLVVNSPPRALIDLGLNQIAFAQLRWALVFAAAAGLPFVIRHIRSSGPRTAGGIGAGIGVTALAILAAIGVARIRVLSFPAATTAIDQEWKRIYFCLHGCGFQTAFASIAIVACFAAWAHAARASSNST